MTFFRGLTPHMKNELDRHITGDYGEGAFHDYEDEEWLSECCGAPPFGEGLPAGEHPAGTCSQCREHCVFEKEEPA